MGLFSKTPPIDKFMHTVSEIECVLPIVLKLQNSNLTILHNKNNLKSYTRELLSIRTQCEKLANNYPEIAVIDPIFYFQGHDYKLSIIIYAKQQLNAREDF